MFFASVATFRTILRFKIFENRYFLHSFFSQVRESNTNKNILYFIGFWGLDVLLLIPVIGVWLTFNSAFEELRTLASNPFQVRELISNSFIMGFLPAIGSSIGIIGFISLVWLFTNIAIIDVINYFERKWHNVWGKVREDRLRATIAPDSKPNIWINRLTDAISQFWAKKRLNLLIWLSPLIVPLLYLMEWLTFEFISLITLPSDTTPSIITINTSFENWDLLVLSPWSLISLFLVCISGTITLVQIKKALDQIPRHVVRPFKAVASKNGDNLEPLANLTAHALSHELQQIGKLLAMRQVENSQTMISNESYALFVTSGQNLELINQIQNFATVEVSSNTLKFDFSSLVLLFSRAKPDTQINGHVQRQENNTLEIIVEMSRRNSPSISAKIGLLPEHGIDELDEFTIQQLVRKLAIKLIFQMYQSHKISSTEESFEHFISGLEASRQRNWWLAIWHYRRAIAIDESNQSKFGLGHYHLSAALFFQGDFENGLRHLEMADTYGPPLPEIQYMLARATMIQYWNDLHLNTTMFKKLEYHCRQAIHLKSDFPEAEHLLGAAYYRRGRLLERDTTNKYNQPINEPFSGQKWNSRELKRVYRQSDIYLKRSIQKFSRKQKTLKHNGDKGSNDENTFLTQSRMIATHQLADTKRALGQYQSAERYYEEVLIAYPRNLRSMIDLAKTYCLAQLWKRADEFLRRQVLILDEGKWNADANFYMGWALLGGLSAQSQRRGLKKRLDNRIEKLGLTKKEDSLNILQKATAHLDFAFHQRSRYLARWKQNDWFQDAEQAFDAVYKQLTSGDGSIDQFATKQLGKDKNHKEVYAMAVWLAYRITLATVPSDANNVIDSSNLKSIKIDTQLTDMANMLLAIGQTTSEQGDSATGESNQLGEVTKVGRVFNCETENFPASLAQILAKAPDPFKNLLPLCYDLIYLRKLAGDAIHNIDNSNREVGLRNKWRRLNVAHEAEKVWKIIKEIFSEPKWEFSGTLYERIAIDLFAEAGLLAARFYTEGGAHDLAYNVSNATQKIMTTWRIQWEAAHGTQSEPTFRFSQYVFRYQFAGIQAWAGHSLAMKINDIPTRVMSKLLQQKVAKKSSNKRIDLLPLMEEHINKSLATMSLHPLATYVQALRLNMTGQGPQAITELHQLLQIIAPFDPFRYLVDLGPKKPFTRSENSKPTYLRSLDMASRISGRLQFDNIIDQARIHKSLADFFYEQEEYDLSIEHLHSALIWSPHDDLDAENFLALAKRLSLAERYQEAEAVLEAMRGSDQRLANKSLAIGKRLEPSIADCVVLTRQGHHGRSYNLGRTVARSIRLYPLDSRPKGYAALEGMPESNEQVDYALMHEFNKLYHEFLSNLDEKLKGSSLDKIREKVDATIQFKKENFDTILQSELTNSSGANNTFDSWEKIFKTTQIADEQISTSEHDTKASLYEYLPKIIALENREEAKVALPQLILLAYLRIWMSKKSWKLREDSDQFANELDQSWILNLNTLVANLSKNRQEDTVAQENSLAHSDSKEQIKNIMRSHFLFVHMDEAVRQLFQIAELSNTLAYNKAELDMHHHLAFEDAKFSIIVLEFLLSQGSNSLEPLVYDEYRKSLAQYYDSFGWVCYRQANRLTKYYAESNEKVLIAPQLILALALAVQEGGLKYDPRRSILHYHLARAHITSLEYFWQSITKNEAEIGLAANKINMHLRAANRHWRNAAKFDSRKRLHSRLTWLKQRIDEYQTGWHSRHLAIFGGDHNRLLK